MSQCLKSCGFQTFVGISVSSRSTLPKIDAVYDALDDEHNEIFLNSCFEKLYNVRSMQISPKLIHNMLIKRLHVWCTLHTSPEERKEEYVRLFVSGPRREDPILDAYLHKDGADGAVGYEKPDDIFEQV
ncbi:Uncharacterized protein Fot_23924 [Forsythia ovata]|uniref:Uncharacterized protein n=1 Tax=Forsythia ovata TaxID=205694 RepID=A0ABD1U4R3_9LAMI